MTIRKRKDSPPKPGMGIDGTEGEDFSRKYAKDPWGYGGASQGSETSYGGEYSPNSDGDAAQRTSSKDFQFWAETRDILDDVEANSRPRGDDNFGFDATGPIKYGVNKKQ
jgi:hypothetical protein